MPSSEMRIGLELSAAHLSAEEVVELARLAESRGLDSLWLQEGIGRDVVSLLGALSAATSDIGLATGPINLWSRTPYLIAMTAATLAELSGGRFRLGLSPGHAATVESHHGLSLIPLDDAPKRVREALLILRALLAGEAITLEGDYLRVSGAKLPISPSLRVPIHINARQGEILEAVGELISGAIISIATPAWFRQYALPRIAAGAARAGRPAEGVDVAYHPVLCLSEDEAVAVEAARRVVASYFLNAEVQRLLSDYGYADEMARLAEARNDGQEVPPSAELVKAICLVGGVEAVSRRIEEYRESGVRLMIMRPQPVDGGGHADAIRRAIDALVAA